jgi:hypothetical protein
MRTEIFISGFALLSAMALMSASRPLAAREPGYACMCHGCGCKGGPGWRDRNNQCVSPAQLKNTCGEPPSTKCTFEGAKQVCPTESRGRR